ncbi:uncharacterized protein L3040_002073 [Drepanopeziza brunnea f. sp. 'multigermtubi']|nr:hypothetical protein L3040_002073 [Drepanopeziza brunnea f. sp. 'multigermtubi']
MLLRVQISGKEIDVRSNGYWEIGAALLMRSLDKKKKYSYDDAESDAEDFAEQVKDEGRESRWGTKEGLEQASEYYHRMILEFPHRKFFRGHATAVDFWPAMVGCELYGIQYEYEDGLRRVEKQKAIDDEEDGSGDESQESGDESQSLESEDGGEDPEDDSFTINQRRKERTPRKRAEKRWAEREDVRKAALAASKAIAAKLDHLVDDQLYLTSHNILRLRGMLALYIGDLSVPAMPLPYDDEDQNGNSLRRSGRRGGLVESSERRLQFRERIAEHDRGKKKQADEHDRAAKLFDKISGNSGEDEDVQHLALETVRKERQR